MCGQVLCYQGKGATRDPRAGMARVAGVHVFRQVYLDKRGFGT